MHMHTPLSAHPAKAVVDAAPLSYSPVSSDDTTTDSALLAALTPFSRKAGASRCDASDCDVIAFLAAFGVPGPCAADWHHLFRAADAAGYVGPAVGSLVACAACGCCCACARAAGRARAAAMARYAAWLVDAGGWADDAMRRTARARARAWRVRADGPGCFVLVDGGGECRAECGAVDEMVDAAAGRVVEEAVDEVVRGVVARAGEARRGEVLRGLRGRAGALVETGQNEAKRVVMEMVFSAAP